MHRISFEHKEAQLKREKKLTVELKLARARCGFIYCSHPGVECFKQIVELRQHREETMDAAKE